MYKPCDFDRQAYLGVGAIFENLGLNDVQSELDEFNDDAENLAYELAYTRYALAKLEKSVKEGEETERQRAIYGPLIPVTREEFEAMYPEMPIEDKSQPRDGDETTNE